MKRPLRLGMIGGGQGAYIGNIHRIAARQDGAWQLVAGTSTSMRHAATPSPPAKGSIRPGLTTITRQ